VRHWNEVRAEHEALPNEALIEVPQNLQLEPQEAESAPQLGEPQLEGPQAYERRQQVQHLPAQPQAYVHVARQEQERHAQPLLELVPQQLALEPLPRALVRKIRRELGASRLP